MKQYLVSATVALATVALALGFFFAGFFLRGWVDQRQLVALPSSAGQTPTPAQAAPSPTAVPRVNAPLVSDVSADDDPARGLEGAPVTIIEFSDYQCTFCKRYVDQTLPLILETYGDRVRYVFRDFPIAGVHPQAAKAAEAAQCAFDQGKYWEYHELLFQNQAALDVASLKEHAAGLGLDPSAFDLCLDSNKYAQEVQKDFDDGRAYGVTGAPTFFINGHKVTGAQPFAAFQKIIDQELAKASAQ